MLVEVWQIFEREPRSGGRNNTPRSKEAFELDEKGGKKVILSKGGKN